jgi:hypothetical protein
MKSETAIRSFRAIAILFTIVLIGNTLVHLIAGFGPSVHFGDTKSAEGQLAHSGAQLGDSRMNPRGGAQLGDSRMNPRGGAQLGQQCT